MNKISNIKNYYLFNFLRGLFFTSGVLVPFFTEWGKISFAQIQILQSWFMFWSFVLEIPTGIIADRFSRRLSLILGAAITGIAVIIYGLIPNFYNFLLGEFFFALGMALISGADKALLYDTLKENQQEHLSTKIFGQAFSFHMAGLLIAAPFGSFLASKFGLNVPLLCSCIPFFFATLVAFRLKEVKQQDKTSESIRYLNILKQGFQFLKNNKKFMTTVLNAILVNAAGYFVIWLYQPLLSKIKIPIIYFGYFHAFLVIVEILISHNFNFFEKICKTTENYFKFSAIITSIGFLLVALYTNLFTIIFFLVLSGGFGLTYLNFIFAHINKTIPDKERATLNSFISMFDSLFLVLINPLVGLLIDQSLRLALFSIFLLPLIALVFNPTLSKKVN